LKDAPKLINLRKDKAIIIEKYDVFEKWRHEKADLIIAANVLNRSYFSDNQIKKALLNIFNALNNLGRFVVVDNRENEKATIFRMVNGVIEIEKDINNGTEIKEIALGMFPPLDKQTYLLKNLRA